MKGVVYVLALVLFAISGASYCNPLAGGDPKAGPAADAAPHALRPAAAPRGPGQEASVLYFLSREAGWVVLGADLYATRDGGKSWTPVNRGGVAGVQAILFVNEKDGWAIRDEWATQRHANFVLRTRDGGRTWQEALRVGSPVFGLDFFGERVGYLKARWEEIQGTVDGGETWEELVPDNGGDSNLATFEGLHRIYPVGETEAWGYGAGIWHTADGGQSWQPVVPDDAVRGRLYSAFFLDRETGWIVGSGRQVWRTTDGRTWHKSSGGAAAEAPPDPSAKEPPGELYGVSFNNRAEGWVLGGDGALLHTTDGGVTWKRLPDPPRRLRALSFTNSREGWAVDEENNLLRTGDGGSRWEVQRIPT
ncbi:MAG TPA: YCF48-related protein [Pyrinomonadaceae bacterium]|jgi:photosystem II stability/assembly factor-like uncharacterized protein|nr:YCF48-related protein [Pyrinomonadaceae bacterium]